GQEAQAPPPEDQEGAGEPRARARRQPRAHRQSGARASPTEGELTMAKASHARHHAKRDPESDNGAARPRALWTGTISFGLVSVPVELFPANRPGRPGLRWLAPSGLPVQRRYASSEDGKEVP